MREQLAEVIKQLEDLLDGLPFGDKLKKEIEVIRNFVLEQRPPRFALVGRRGSGKSSLINAIFGAQVAKLGHIKAQQGAAEWWPYDGDLGTIEILDTRGLQEGSKPEEFDMADDPVESISNALRERPPDAILFLIKASEVDSAVDSDLEGLGQVSDEVEKVHGYRPPIVAIITHCDLVEPQYLKLHDTLDEDEDEVKEKLERIREIERHLQNKIRSAGNLKGQLIGALGVSSYQSWRKDGTCRKDERWRIDELITYLAEELPSEAQVELARLSRLKSLQKKVSERLTKTVATVCGGVAAAPIPVADLAPITALQVGLVSSIGYISGRSMSLKSAAEFISALGINVGAGFAFREAARALLRLVPVGGNLASAAIAFSVTMGIGKSAIAYFIDGMDASRLREYYENVRTSRESQPTHEDSVENIDL